MKRISELMLEEKREVAQKQALATKGVKPSSKI
jgi:hypothetical protein